MCAVWMTVEAPKPCSTSSSPTVPELEVIPTFATKTCKRDMGDAKININAWESLTEDRKAWKSAVRSGVEGDEADRMEQLVQKRAK